MVNTCKNKLHSKQSMSRLREDGHLFWREGTGWSISPNVLNAIEVWLKLCKKEELNQQICYSFFQN